MMSFSDIGIIEKPGRQRYATICPFCNDKREKHRGAQCLTVNDEPGNRWYKCHHCDRSGNLDVEDKFDKVREKAKMPSKERAYTMEVRAYLQKRGIGIKTAKASKLYEQSAFGKTQICFPFFMGYTLVNVKFLNMSWKPGDPYAKWIQMKKADGTRPMPFGMQAIKTHDDQGNKIHTTVIITEGEWDKLTWDECEYPNAVSVPMGAPSLKAKDFTKEFAYLQDPYVKSVFDQVDLFYLSLDDDPAGKKLQYHMSMILGKEKCRIIQYPSGYKDINEVMMGNEKKKLPALGKEGVKECYNNLKAVPIKGVVSVGSVYGDLVKIRETGFEPGLGCGVPEVDKLFTVKPKLIMFTTGVPGSGKSVWTRWWLVTMIQHNVDLHLKWALFTPENRPVAREYAKIVEALTGMSIEKNHKNAMNEEMFRKALRWVQKHFFIISPDKMNYEDFGGTVQKEQINTIGSIQKYLIYLKKTENIFGYVIDAWNKIEHEQPKHQTETQFISQQLDRLIDFNEYWDLFGLVIVHPKKIEMTGENYKMPSLYDIKGSSAWKEKADYGVLIHRYKMKKKPHDELRGDEDEDEKWYVVPKAPTIIRTEKIRFEETGTESRVKMEMREWGKFYVVSSDNGGKKAIEAPPPDDRIEQNKDVFVDDDEDDDLPF